MPKLIESELKNPVWEQQPGEPPASYLRYLVFQTLGMGVEIKQAWETANRKNPKESEQVSLQTWYDDSSDYCWRYRAAHYHTYQIVQHGTEATKNFYSALNNYSRILAELTERKLATPETHADLLLGFQLVGNHVSPQIVGLWQQINSSGDPDTTETEAEKGGG